MLPKAIQYFFEKEIWEKGKSKNYRVVDIQVHDSTHIYVRVFDKVIYTVYIDLSQFIFKCNCHHYDHCIHQAVALNYLIQKPEVSSTTKSFSMELTLQDKAILCLEESENNIEKIHEAVKMFENQSLEERIKLLYIMMGDYYLYEISWSYLKSWYKERGFIKSHTKLILENEGYLSSFIVLYKYADFSIYLNLFYDFYMHSNGELRKWISRYIKRVEWIDEGIFKDIEKST